MEDEPNRAERRRQEKEAAKPKPKAVCNECKEGPCEIAPRVFDKCPVCGCPTTFTTQAMKSDVHLQDIGGKQPALFSMEKLYDTPTYNIKLVAVGASCARCGVFFTIARDKIRSISLVAPRKPGGRGPGLILPGQGG